MWARIIANRVVELIATDPAVTLHPDLAAAFQPAPPGIEAGAERVDGVWVNPAALPPPPPPSPPSAPGIGTRRPTPPQFMTLFTAGERIAIRSSGDAIVQDFLSLIDDPRMAEIDLDSPPVGQGLGYLVSQELLADERRLAIFSGAFPA